MPREPRFKLEKPVECHCENLTKLTEKEFLEKIEEITGDKYTTASDGVLYCAKHQVFHNPILLSIEKEDIYKYMAWWIKNGLEEITKRCKYCGTDYQDPKYCSVHGRSADKHTWL